MFEVQATHASPQPSDSIYSDGQLVRSITSADWRRLTCKNIAYGFLLPGVTTGLTVDIIGRPYKVKCLDGAIYDPSNSRVKS